MAALMRYLRFSVLAVIASCYYDLSTATYRMLVSCLPSAPDRSSNADTVRSMNEPYIRLESDARSSRRHRVFNPLLFPICCSPSSHAGFGNFGNCQACVTGRPISLTSAQHLVQSWSCLFVSQVKFVLEGTIGQKLNTGRARPSMLRVGPGRRLAGSGRAGLFRPVQTSDGQWSLSIGNDHFQHLAEQKPLNRSKQKLEQFITSAGPPSKPKFIMIGRGVAAPHIGEIRCKQLSSLNSVCYGQPSLKNSKYQWILSSP
jgi:hypothetical protein